MHEVDSQRDRATPKRETRTAVARMEKAGVKDETARFNNSTGRRGGQTCIILFYRLLSRGLNSRPSPTCAHQLLHLPRRSHFYPYALAHPAPLAPHVFVARARRLDHVPWALRAGGGGAKIIRNDLHDGGSRVSPAGRLRITMRTWRPQRSRPLCSCSFSRGHILCREHILSTHPI